MIMVMIQTILFIVLPAVITFTVEFIQIRNLGEILEWIKSHPYQMVLGYVLILLFFALLYIIFCRMYIAMLGTSTLFMLLALINYYKIIIRGDPFMPWDLLLNKEASNIVAYLNIPIDKTIILLFGVLLLMVIIVAFFKPAKIWIRYRVIGVVIIICITTLFMKNTYFHSENMEKLQITDIFWNQKRNYEINGFLTGFGMNIRNIIITPPTSYSEKTVNDIIEEYEEVIPAFANERIKPNIIMIMNEAFWDPTQFHGITYSEDPIPTINKLRQEAVSGWVFLSQYGGATANTEFEVLTGNSVVFLPSGSMAYQQYIKKPMGSMVSYLRNNGYNTIAIHPYQKWFWDRETVYPYLGFDQFISDEDFINPHKRGQFISDMEVTNEIIRQYENNKGKPFFNYTVTMQNHGPYEDKRYGDNTIKVKSDILPGKSKDILQTYVEGVKDADQALAELIEYFKEADEPTIIAMFGDHLPMLGNDYSVYREAGYIGKDTLTLEDEQKLHQTPFVIWSNYKNEKREVGLINSSYLGAYTMEYANISMPVYFNFLNEIRKEMPAFISGINMNVDGSVSEKPSERQRLLRQKYWTLQYDLMFGQGYGQDILFGN